LDSGSGGAATGNALWPTVDRRVRRTSRDVEEAERSRRLNSVSAGRRSSSAGMLAPYHVDICTPNLLDGAKPSFRHTSLAEAFQRITYKTVVLDLRMTTERARV